jgi:hypothetical protein
MSDYTKIVDYAVKDGYTTGNPLKLILGSEIDAEYDAIAAAIATKADTSDFSGTIANLDYTNVSAAHTKGKSTTESTLTDGATVTINCTLSNAFVLTLGGNRTMAAPTSPLSGQVINLLIKQDATGSRTITWNAAFTWPSGTAPTLSTAANSVDMVSMRYDVGASKWRCVASVGFA